MPSYKLFYFDLRGRAEISRFLFALAKVPYEDVRYPIGLRVPGDFSTVVRPEFDAAKAAGELDASMGQVPCLEVDGTRIGQSRAIERFLAREFGMFGDTALEAAQVDKLCETVRDIQDAFLKFRTLATVEEKKAAVEKYNAEDLPRILQAAERSVPAGPGPWLVGSKLSLADVAFYSLLGAPKGAGDSAEAANAAFQDCPRIKASVEAVAAIPELQEYLAQRKETPL